MKRSTWMERVAAFKRIETPIHVNRKAARSLGRKLREARLRRGLSVTWVCEDTRLYPEIIDAMEEGRYEGLHGLVYCKGYLRTYAAYLGLDVAEAFKIFGSEESEEHEAQVEAVIERPIAKRSPQAPSKTTTQANERRPPKYAEYLLYFFIPREQRAYTLGDLEQEYGEVLDKFGTHPARMFYWGQVGCSLWPYLQRAVRQARLLLWLINLIRSVIRSFGWH